MRAAKARALQRTGIEVFPTKLREGHIDLRAALRELGKREILSVLLEAGSVLNGAALATDSVDKIFLFYAPKIAGQATVPFATAERLMHKPLLDLNIRQFGPDFAVEGMLHDVYRDH